MSVSRDEVVNITSDCCFTELVVVRVVSNSSDVLLWGNELSNIANRFDLLLDLVFVDLEALLQERFPKLGERRYGDDDLILMVESLDK